MKHLINLFLILTFSITIHAQQKVSFADSTKQCEKVATEYFKQYFELKFDKMANLMHDSISFADPTAELVFGGKKIEGKENVLKNFKTAYASITEINPEISRKIFSGNIAIIESIIQWKFINKQTNKTFEIEMPLIVILTIKNGKVVKHRDYGDYNYFIKQYNAQLE